MCTIGGMQILAYKLTAEGVLELVEQPGLRDDEDELTVPVVISWQIHPSIQVRAIKEV